MAGGRIILRRTVMAFDPQSEYSLHPFVQGIERLRGVDGKANQVARAVEVLNGRERAQIGLE